MLFIVNWIQPSAKFVLSNAFRIYVLSPLKYFAFGFFALGLLQNILKNLKIDFPPIQRLFINLFDFVLSISDGKLLIALFVLLLIIIRFIHPLIHRKLIQASVALLGYFVWEKYVNHTTWYIDEYLRLFTSGVVREYPNLGWYFHFPILLVFLSYFLLCYWSIPILKTLLSIVKHLIRIILIWLVGIKKLDVAYLFFLSLKRRLFSMFYSVENNSGVEDEPLENIATIEELRALSRNPQIFKGFEEAVEKLTLLINSSPNAALSKSSIRVCLNGKWGSGKTSVVRIVKEGIFGNMDFVSEKNTAWIKFNPWGYSNGDEMVGGFYRELKKALYDNFGIGTDGDLDRLAKVVTPLVESNSSWRPVWQPLIDLFRIRQKTYAEIKDLIRKRLQRANIKIVILIDDLDRLEYEEILLILKLIRENVDFPGLFFVLPFDYKVVSKVIRTSRHDLDSYGNYLSKIISERVDLQQYTFEELESIFVHSLSLEFKSGRLVLDLDRFSNLRRLFECFVLEFSKGRFSSVNEDDNLANIGATDIGPLSALYQPIFDQFSPSLSYFAHVNSILEGDSGLKSLVKEHLSGEIKDISRLVERLRDPVAKVVRENIASAKSSELHNATNRHGMPAALDSYIEDEIISRISSGVGRSVAQDRNHIIESRVNSFWEKPDAKVHRDANDQAYTEIQGILTTLVNDVHEYVARYELDVQSNDHSFIIDWITTGLTPRDVKLFVKAMSAMNKKVWNEDTPYAIKFKEKLIKDYCFARVDY